MKLITDVVMNRCGAAALALILAGTTLAQNGSTPAPSKDKPDAAAAPDKSKTDKKDAKSDKPARAKAGMPQVGDVAPEWTLNDLEGKPLALKDLRGKVVLLDFWATWCPPCRAVMPELQKLHEELGDKGLVVLGMNAWEGRGKISEDEADKRAIKYKHDNKFTYRGVLRADDAAKAYGVSGIPTMYAIGPDGKVIGSWVGAASKDVAAMKETVKKAVDELAKAKPADGTGATPAPEKKAGG